MSDKESNSSEKKPVVIKNATDLQRLKLEKLMKNPVSIHYDYGYIIHIIW